uniref:Cyclic nucleotide-binding domain-containing protein n=1 Tax=Cyprinus carpio carpio TaxID=630221 RepID=A0A9J8C9G2_CYPCA
MGTLRDLQFSLQTKIEELQQRDTLIDELELDAKDELIRQLQGELDPLHAASVSHNPSGTTEVTGELATQSRAWIDDNGHILLVPEQRYQMSHSALNARPYQPNPQGWIQINSAMSPSTTTAKARSELEAGYIRSQRLIQKALLENDFVKHLEASQILTIMDCMFPNTLAQGCCVIQEGDDGSTVYVPEEGLVEVTKGGQKLCTIEPGKVFG